MKKTILIILTLMLAAAMLIGCAQKESTEPNEDNFQQIKAVIQDVHDNQLFVHAIQGLDGIEDIYLNYSEDVTMNISEDAPLVPGNIVTAIIGTEIMESYPPQAILYEIIQTEPGDSTDDTQSAKDDTQLAPDEYITAKVTAIDGNIYTIEVLSANLYSGTMTLTIPADVLDADMPIELGYLIGVYIAENGDTYTAEKIVFSEPDAIVTLDPRESISGYLDGMFPSAVYGQSDAVFTVEAGVPFAIALDENCESSWTMTPQDGVTLEAQGASQPSEDGSYTNYFGIVIDTPGVYTLEFVYSSPDQNFDFTFTVTVE